MYIRGLDIKKIKTAGWLTFFLFLVNPIFLFSQNQNIPLNHQFYSNLERQILENDEIIHSVFKPIIQRKANVISDRDSLLFPALNMEKTGEKSLFGRKLFHDHLLFIDSNNIQLSIDPILELELGDDKIEDPRGNKVDRYYKNTRGFVARLNIGEQLSIESTFRENQAVLPYYLSQRISSSKVAYGQGRSKKFKDAGFDFAMASAYVSYSPIDRVNIQAGHGKHFIGEGYRSLLLSDLAFNYPYFRLQTDWLDGKLNYQNMYAIFQNLRRVLVNSLNEEIFEREQAAFHFINYKPTSNFSIGFFEGLMYPSLDTSGNIPVPATYWLPVIGLNTAINGRQAETTTILGTNISWDLLNRLRLYGQLSTMNARLNQLGVQAGGKLFLAKAWMLQLEYNKGKSSMRNGFTHYNESLNHPARDDFEEFIAGVYFQKNRWMSRLSYNNLKMKKLEVNYIDARQSFIINPAYNLTLNLGVQNRVASFPFLTSSDREAPFKKEIISEYAPYGGIINSTYFYFSISTNLQNKYFDY